jgi:hypothetical protein
MKKAVGWNHPAKESVQSQPFPEGCGTPGEAFFAGGIYERKIKIP